MLRFWTACLALVLAAPAGAGAEELKPKFGDVDGIYYTEVSDDREACEQAIRNKIAICSQNTDFISNALNRKHPGCLPIFSGQARACADHFRSEAYKCRGSGPTRIGDFTGFSCTVTETAAEEGSGPEPGIAPADRMMQARTRTNVRSGPGTDHARVGLLEAGEEVRVTGEAGEWLRIEGPDGSAAFVHGPLLVPVAREASAQESSEPAAALSPKCAGMGRGAECWLGLANRPGCHVFDSYYNPLETAVTWSGSCAGGVAIGQGTWSWDSSASALSGEETGTLVRGIRHGHWIERWSNGRVREGPYADGRRHGHWITRWSDGGASEGRYVDGKRHGRWVLRFSDGGCTATLWSHGNEGSESDC